MDTSGQVRHFVRSLLVNHAGAAAGPRALRPPSESLVSNEKNFPQTQTIIILNVFYSPALNSRDPGDKERQ